MAARGARPSDRSLGNGAEPPRAASPAVPIARLAVAPSQRWRLLRGMKSASHRKPQRSPTVSKAPFAADDQAARAFGSGATGRLLRRCRRSTLCRR